MALPRFRLKKAAEPKPDIQKVAGEAALQSEGIVISGADRPSTSETLANSAVSQEKLQSFIDSRKPQDDAIGLGNEPDEPSTRDQRGSIFDAGSGDLTSIFGSAPSTKDQLAAALGIDPDNASRGGSGAGAGATSSGTGSSSSGGSSSTGTQSGGPRGSDGGPTGMWGLGGGRTTHADTGFDLDNGATHARIGSGSIANGAVSGVAPIGYDDEEGVRAGQGMRDLAEQYKGAPSVSPDKLAGATGDALRQAMDEIDDLGTTRHASKDGAVTSERKSDGTLIVTNRDNGTTTRLNPDGSSVTTETATGKVVDKSPAPSQPVDETPPLPPEILAVHHAIRGDLSKMKPNTGSGDIDPDDNPAATDIGEGEPVNLKDMLLTDPPDPEAGISGPRSGTPTMADFGGLPGDVDPTEDTFIPSSPGPEDDPLASVGNPGLKPRASATSSSEDEAEDDEDEED